MRSHRLLPSVCYKELKRRTQRQVQEVDSAEGGALTRATKPALHLLRLNSKPKPQRPRSLQPEPLRPAIKVKLVKRLALDNLHVQAWAIPVNSGKRCVCIFLGCHAATQSRQATYYVSATHEVRTADHCGRSLFECTTQRQVVSQVVTFG